MARECKASGERYAKKWKVHDIIYPLEDDRGEDELVLYKVVKVSQEHETVTDCAMINCQLFKSVGNTHTLTGMVWKTLKPPSWVV